MINRSLKEPINVISLFDGMACLYIALKEEGIKVNKYYSCENDKFAIKQTKHNFPEIIRLGEIEQWRSWDIDWSNIHLVGAGSPCQGFSFAGKQLNFEDERSKLFFIFHEILEHIKTVNPEVNFLLENVVMKKEYQKVINDYMGMFPARLNSNKVSAQNRDRLYWSNIKTRTEGLFNEVHTDIKEPKDRGIYLKHILEPEESINEKYYLTESTLKSLIEWGERNKAQGNGFKLEIRTGEDKSTALTTGSFKSSSTYIKMDKQLNVKNDQNKASCLTAGAKSGGNHSDMDVLCVSLRGRNPDNPNDRRAGIPLKQHIEPRLDGKSNCLTSIYKDNLVMIGGFKDGKFIEGRSSDFKQGARVYSPEGKAVSITANGGGLGAKTGIYEVGFRLRRLTPLECTRLQTVPEWYEWIVSDTQIYKMLGNGWTIEMIREFIKLLKYES